MLPDPVRSDRFAPEFGRPVSDRHLFGAGAAVCAVCCAAPILSILGIAGTAATAFTFVLAGTTFALVVGSGAAVAWWTTKRRTNPCPSGEPIALEPPARIGGSS